MYNKQLGAALNYGQSMVPGKSSKSPNKKKNLRKAVLQKKKR
jgi:hypothetical protein